MHAAGELERVVFERTPQGLLVAKAPEEAKLPLRLRTLLLAVDGRTTVGQFVPFLTGLAPLPEKFLELENLGLLRRKVAPSAARASGQLPAATVLQVDDVALRMLQNSYANAAPAAAAAPGAQQPAAPNAAAQHNLSNFEAELKLLEQMMLSPAATSDAGTVAASAALAGPASYSLADILAEMESFLARTAGMDGLPVSLLLEQIQSVQQLRQELDGYAELVAPYGDAGHAHVLQVQRMLASAR
jgi:hypothetical protein